MLEDAGTCETKTDSECEDLFYRLKPACVPVGLRKSSEFKLLFLTCNLGFFEGPNDQLLLDGSLS